MSLREPLQLLASALCCALSAAAQAPALERAPPSGQPGQHGFAYPLGGVFELGTLPGYDSTSQAVDLDAFGTVVCWSTNHVSQSSHDTHSFLWRRGLKTDLGELPGRTNTFAKAINDVGQVVGTCEDPAGALPPRAFLWEKGALTDLGVLPGMTSSAATAINDAGQIVGRSWSVAGSERAFLWEQGAMKDITLNATSVTPHDIDAAGVVYGSATIAAETYAAYCDGKEWHHVYVFLFGEVGVNAQGDMAGSGYHALQQRAFVKTASAVTWLPGLAGGGSKDAARDVNGAGVVVGAAGGTAARWDQGVLDTFLWSVASYTPWSAGYSSAAAINDRGQIAGYGLYNGKVRAFLALP